MTKNKKIIISAAAVIILIIAMLGIYFAVRQQPAEGSKAFSVEVTHKDGSVKSFNYTTDAEYVGEVLLSEGLISGETGEYGLYVTEVDGEKAVYEADGAYWAFYDNGEYAMTGVDQTPVKDEGSYGFTYTTG